MKCKRNVFIILLVCFVLGLSSCTSDKTSLSETRNASAAASPVVIGSNGNYVKQEADNIKIDASVSAPEITEIPVLLAGPLIVDKKTAESLFFQSEKVSKRTDANNIFVLEGSSGSFLNIVESNYIMGNGFFGYGTSFSTYVNGVFSW